LADFDVSFAHVKQELAAEKSEVARLKSLEQVRLRKLGDKNRDNVELRKKEERESLREKSQRERLAKDRCIRKLELVEAEKRRWEE
jgi:hypothetical protein